jgi:hypothetical protein
MSRSILAIAIALCLSSCGGGDRHNSAMCGITLIAGANRVLDQLANVHAILHEPPVEIVQGAVPTRVVGYATSRSVPLDTSGVLTLGYEGEGLPPQPGFALAVVDDSSEVFRGILVFETEPPQGYPELGVLTQGADSVPLFGLRIHWSSVNSDDCPLFTPQDGGTS